MDLSTTIDRWGPWVLIGCGILYPMLPLPHWLTMVTLNRRMEKLESQLPPHYREMARQHLAKSGISLPFPVFRGTGWKLPAIGAAHVLAGVMWHFFPLGG